MKMTRNKYKPWLELSPKKNIELKENKEISFQNTKELEHIISIKQEEIKELEKALEDLKNHKINENTVFSLKKQDLVSNLEKKKIEFEIETNKKKDLLEKITMLKTGKLQDSSEKKILIENLQNKISSMRDQRKKIGEEIPELQKTRSEKKAEFEKDEKDNLEFFNKLQDLNNEVNKLKDDVSKCTKDNEEVCTRFKSQIEENSLRETELKNSVEIMEKFKNLTETQMNEINKFNEKNNINFKEIAILEKGDIKEWNNYLKEKEKAAKKKKK